jgi:hypothetical protein
MERLLELFEKAIADGNTQALPVLASKSAILRDRSDVSASVVRELMNNEVRL